MSLREMIGFRVEEDEVGECLAIAGVEFQRRLQGSSCVCHVLLAAVQRAGERVDRRCLGIGPHQLLYFRFRPRRLARIEQTAGQQDPHLRIVRSGPQRLVSGASGVRRIAHGEVEPREFDLCGDRERVESEDVLKRGNRGSWFMTLRVELSQQVVR